MILPHPHTPLCKDALGQCMVQFMFYLVYQSVIVPSSSANVKLLIGVYLKRHDMPIAPKRFGGRARYPPYKLSA
jgi:hypothetical protein